MKARVWTTREFAVICAALREAGEEQVREAYAPHLGGLGTRAREAEDALAALARGVPIRCVDGQTLMRDAPSVGSGQVISSIDAGRVHG